MNEAEAMPAESAARPVRWTDRWPGWMLLWSGWLIPQLLLLGPALVGRTVDIPVDLLAHESVYLPRDSASPKVVVHHGVELTDLVFGYPQVREFCARELRAGRLPLWNPHNFAGAPLVGWGYSPFEWLYVIVPSPVTVAWIALSQLLVLGLGFWTLLRRWLSLAYWPAALASWCVPLTGFMTLWHGFATIVPVCWLPWLLVAIHAAIKNPRGWGGLAVAAATALILVAGHMGIAGLVLLTSGLFAVWLLVERAITQRSRLAAASAVAIGAGWMLGFALAAPALLPLMEYVRTGIRMDSHAKGLEERPPEGFEALPPIVRPDVYGGFPRDNWARTVKSGLIESSSSAYAGLLAALWLAPLAWCNRRLRSPTVFLTVLIVISLGWVLKIPGLIDFLRSVPMQPLLSLSYNRWTFATSLAVLSLAAIGLDSLRAGTPIFRWWWGIPVGATAFFLIWCIVRLLTLTRKMDAFSSYFLLGAGLAVVALCGWLATFRDGPRAKWARIALIGFLPLELFAFAWDERRQADRELYFARLQILEQLAALPHDRVWGVACLPPSLNLMYGLDDARGYDAVDPRNYIKLIELACDRNRTIYYAYARTLAAVPAGRVMGHTLKLHPVADLLNVRYLIFREAPQADLPIFLHQNDYWVTENQSALPRAYVPLSARVVKSDEEALAELGKFEFAPKQTVFLQDELELPATMRGTAHVDYETPTRVRLDVDMQTAGLVLHSDLWDPGWHAELDGAACPIYRVDVALRGFRVPAGKHTIVCIYDPQVVRRGFQVAEGGGLLLGTWAIVLGIAGWRRRGTCADAATT